MTAAHGGNASNQEAAFRGFHLAICLLASLPLLADWVAVALGWHIFFLADGRIQSVFATLLVAGAGWPFLTAPFRRPHGWSAALEVAVGLAAVGIYARGMWLTYGVPLGGSHDLFQMAAGLLTAASVLAWVRAVARREPGMPMDD